MAFAGIVRFDGGGIGADVESRLSNAISARTGDEVLVRRGDGATFLQRRMHAITHKPDTRSSFALESERGLFVASARLDNRDEIAASLAIAHADRAGLSDAELLARTLERRNGDGIARCLGAFSFARWNGQERRLTLGRDCLGHRPLFFHRNDRYAVFSDVLAILLALPEVPREIDEIVLANFLALSLEDPRRTFYRGIERTPSRSLVSVDRNGARHRIYWEPNLDPNPDCRRAEDYVERARELFDQAVATTISGTAKVAVSTSGGLDSSAIVATVARLGGVPRISCYTLVPPPDWDVDLGPDQYRDESEKVKALQRLYPQIDLRWITRERAHPLDVDDNYRFARKPHPTRGPLLVSFGRDMRDHLLGDGHSLVLQGTQGNLGLSWPGNFSLQALLRAGAWGQFARDLSAQSREGRRGLARTLLSELILPISPRVLERAVRQLSGRRPRAVTDFCVLNSDFIAEHDLPRQWREAVMDPCRPRHGWSSQRVRVKRLFDNAAPDRDSVSAETDRHGLDVRSPHADRRLLEFALSVPEPLYRRNGIPRSFARAVFADRLPPEILNERRKGAEPTPWFRALEARRHLFAGEIERFENSALASRLLDLPRLKRLLQTWPGDERDAQRRYLDYKLAFARGMHVGRFILWVEGGNA